jgi:hypothetical protein
MLTASEVLEHFDPNVAGVRDCYVRYGESQGTATGTLQLEMIIKPSGSLVSVTVTAPGIAGDRLEECVQQASSAWKFPSREGYTIAVIPLNFLETPAPATEPARRSHPGLDALPRP